MIGAEILITLITFCHVTCMGFVYCFPAE